MLPRFKSKDCRQSISYPQNVKFDGDKIKLPKIGLVHCQRHRDFKGNIKTVTVSRNPDGKYFVSKVHSKIARCREDFLHKLSRKVVNENQVIAVENLNIKGMVKNHNLAKAISDAGWGMFRTMLKYKSEREGKQYIEIDRWFPSSKTCYVCLNRADKLSLDVRAWTCKHCGTHHDRDVNAAINIRNEALRILQLGSVRVLALGTSASACGGDVSQPGKTAVLLDAVPVESGSPILANGRVG